MTYLAAGFCGIFALQASADTFSASGGLGFGRNSGLNDIKNPAPVIGADYTFNLGAHLDLGGFYDHTFVTFNDGNNGSVRFMGILARYSFLGSKNSGPFAGVKAGLSQLALNGSGNDTVSSKIGYGGELGYKFALTHLMSIGPKLGIRMIRDSSGDASTDQLMTDFSVALSFHF